MAIWTKRAITNAGLAFIANSEAQGLPINITKCSTSSTLYSQSELAGLTSLTNIEQTVDINEKTTVNSTTVKVTANFDNSQLASSYDLCSYGVYANNGTGTTEVLLLVASADSGETIPPASSDLWQALFNSYIPVSSASEVTINVDLGANATQQYVQEYVSSKLNSSTVVTIPADDGTNYTEVLDPSTSAVMYYTIDIAVAGMTDDFVGTNAIDYVIPMNNGVVDIDLSDERAEAFSQRIGAWSQNGSIKFAFREKPTIDIPVYIYGL